MCNLGLSMRLPQCFESYCTPVNDLELLNGRFVDPHYERGFPSLTSLIIIICVSLLSKTLTQPCLASPPHLYHMSCVFAFLFRRCFFPRKKKSHLSSRIFFKVELLPARRSSLSLRVFASCSSKKRSLHLSSRFFVLELLLCPKIRACFDLSMLFFFLINLNKSI